MSLFTVNRYLGDEVSEVEEATTTGQAQAILQKIHKQAKDRQRRSLTIKSETDKDLASNTEEGVKEKTRTKRKNAKVKQEEGEDSEGQATPKKKAKHEGHQTSADIETDIKQFKKNKQKSQNTPEKKIKRETKTNKKSPKSDDKASDLADEEQEPDPDHLPQGAETGEGRDVDSEENSGDEGEEKTREQNKEVGGFTIIGDVRKKKIEKVQRVLPDWLLSPALVTNDLKDSAAGLEVVSGLDESLLQRLRDNNITHFFPVQRLVIPVLLGAHRTGHLLGPAGYRPSDICCSAPTGSGKTLAFVLPIIQALRHRVIRQVRALVVLPVRDLASQVYKVFATYCTGTNLKVGLLIGHKSFKNEQQNLIRKGVRGLQVQADIVVATPGRLVDHIKQTPGFNLHHLRYLVIDEADRMMEHVKQDWLVQVEEAVYGPGFPRSPPTLLTAATFNKMEMPLQKLLFSATLSQNPEKLQQLNLFQPRLFTAVVPGLTTGGAAGTAGESKSDVIQTKGDFIGRFTTPAGLAEYMVQARDPGEKPLLVLYFLHHRQFRHVLVFTNSVESTHRLYHLIRLVGGLQVQEFSSGLHAMQRNRILKKFAAGKIDVLICSDAMARGMDVENVQCVMSYDHAPYVKTYIHRIGRTARAGKVGTAITLLEKKEVFNFKKMVREAGKEKVTELKVSRGDVRGLLPDYQRALGELPGVLEAEKRNR